MKKYLIFASVLLPILTAGTVYAQTDAATNSNSDVGELENSQQCVMDGSTPIIPDGYVASEDELLSAQRSIKAFQEKMLDFRDCILTKQQQLNTEDANYETEKARLQKLSDESLAIETDVANEYNQAVRAYKER